jgi:hypothetical protein
MVHVPEATAEGTMSCVMQQNDASTRQQSESFVDMIRQRPQLATARHVTKLTLHVQVQISLFCSSIAQVKIKEL